MAVFTAVSRQQAEQWLEGFALGRLVSLEGITSGIENSNFFLDAEKGTLCSRFSSACQRMTCPSIWD